MSTGRDSYKGFDYQITISVWLSLVFLFKKDAKEILVEPLSGEDLEVLRGDKPDRPDSQRRVKLKVTPADALPERKDGVLPLGTRKLLVQIKSRRTGTWTAGEIATILCGNKNPKSGKKKPKRTARRENSGTDASSEKIDGHTADAENDDTTNDVERQWAYNILNKDPTAIFLFVTSAGIASDISCLHADDFDFAGHSTPPNVAPPKKWNLKEEEAKQYPKILQRVGIIHGQDQDAVELKIGNFLAERLKVPYSKREACLGDLTKRIAAGMLDAKHQSLTREQIERIVRLHDGLPEGPRLFVPPRNWSEIQAHLREKHAIFIVGEPGTGKSTIAEKLIHNYRIEREPFREIRPTSPTDLDPFKKEQKERLIIYVQDPFGAHMQAPNRQHWKVELERLCAKIGEDLKVVITSPIAFTSLVPTKSNLKDVQFACSPGMFDGSELLDTYLDDARLPDKHRQRVKGDKENIIKRLDRPHCYEVLTSQLRRIASDALNDDEMNRIVEDSASDAIGLEIEVEFENKPDRFLRGLAAIWLMIEISPDGAFREQHVNRIQQDLVEFGVEAEAVAVMDMLDKFRYLKKSRRGRRMHATYRAAILTVLNRNQALVANTFGKIVDAYLARGNVSEILPLLRGLNNVIFLPAKPMTKILRWSCGPAGNEDAFAIALCTLARHDHETAQPMVLLGKALLCGFPSEPGDNDSWDFILSTWKAPQWDDLRRGQVIQHPDTMSVTRAFVKWGFPGFRTRDQSGAYAFVDFLYQLADVSEEFANLFDDVMLLDRYGDFRANAIAYGFARANKVNLEIILNHALDEYKTLLDWEREMSQYESTEHVADEHAELKRPITFLIDALLEAHACRGNRAFAATRTEPIIFECFVDRIRRGAETDLAVIEKVFDRCPDDESIKRFLEKFTENAKLFELLVRAVGMVPSRLWVWLLVQIRLRTEDDENDTRFKQVTATMLTFLPRIGSTARVALAYDLTRKSSKHDVIARFRDDVVEELDTMEHSTWSMLHANQSSNMADCVEVLESLSETQTPAGRRALIVLARGGRVIESRIAEWLAPDSDKQCAVAAIEVVEGSNYPQRSEHARQALKHRVSKVRDHAVTILCEIGSDEAFTRLLAATDDPLPLDEDAIATALLKMESWSEKIQKAVDEYLVRNEGSKMQAVESIRKRRDELATISTT